MKLIVLIIFFALAGCTKADLSQNELKKAIEQCSQKEGIYKMTIYTNGTLAPLTYCKDGTKWRASSNLPLN